MVNVESAALSAAVPPTSVQVIFHPCVTRACVFISAVLSDVARGQTLQLTSVTLKPDTNTSTVLPTRGCTTELSFTALAPTARTSLDGQAVHSLEKSLPVTLDICPRRPERVPKGETCLVACIS